MYLKKCICNAEAYKEHTIPPQHAHTHTHPPTHVSSFPPFYFPELTLLAVWCVCAQLLQLSPTLCNPMDCGPPCSSVMGFSRQEYWSGLPCPPLGDLPNPGIKPTSLASPALAGRHILTWEWILYCWATGEVWFGVYNSNLNTCTHFFKQK